MLVAAGIEFIDEKGGGPGARLRKRQRAKKSETDATKRALATFGKPFGLELYRKDKDPISQSVAALNGVGRLEHIHEIK